jgi:hypothetical protein
MTKSQKQWVYSPPKAAKTKVPEGVRQDLEKKAGVLVETVLRPKHVQPPPEDERFNYIVDIYTKWYRSYFYFCARYECPGPTAISPTFEAKFARLEYTGEACFTVSFIRHTGQWVELHCGLSVDECLKTVEEDPWFQP